MAVDFGAGNTSRYYSVPDNAALTLPDGDWTILCVNRPANFGANHQYMVSTGVAFTNPGVNLYIAGGGINKVTGIYNDELTNNPSEGAVLADVWRISHLVRRNDVVLAGDTTIAATPVQKTEGVCETAAAGTTSDGINWIMGGNSALNSNRFFLGSISWVSLIKGTGLTLTQLSEIASGATVLMDAPYAGNISNVWHFTGSAAATATDLVGGLDANKNGSGFSSDRSDPILPFTPSGSKGINLVLSDRATSSPRTSVTGIVYRWYDAPTDAGAPVAFGTDGTTDASGVFNLDLAASSLTVGQVGYLVVFKQNGSADLDWHFSGRVTVASI